MLILAHKPEDCLLLFSEGTLFLLQQAMFCEKDIDNILPQWNTSLFTDNNLETCFKHTAMGSKCVIHKILKNKGLNK